MKTDTIAAVATALSDSGIGIIRVSGEDAIGIVDKIYRNKYGRKTLGAYATHTIHYGFIIKNIEEDNRNRTSTKEESLDEVMVSVMKAPRSYTKEDTVEINCHGGILIVRKILEEVLKAGARIAEPGEFTKRAFLNGRIDLARAEAVMDVIHARNEFALQSSLKQLKGSVSEIIRRLREDILYEIAFIESALDDPEHISLDGYPEKLEQKLSIIIEETDKLLNTADNGRILKEGINTAIVGKPNAGKSSLLNALAGEEKAIVTDIAGTTRDALEQTVNLGEVTLNMIDTAGIRESDDPVERIGVQKAIKVMGDADLILYVVDTSVPLDGNDEDIFRMIKDRHTLVLMNKSDLEETVTEDVLRQKLGEHHIPEDEVRILRISAKKNIGMDMLANLIQDMFFHGKINYNDEVYITNMRHKEALCDARESLLQVRESIRMGMPEDFYSIDLMSAYASLGRILGEEVGEDLVNEIFGKFCMGK